MLAINSLHEADAGCEDGSSNDPRESRSLIGVYSYCNANYGGEFHRHRTKPGNPAGATPLGSVIRTLVFGLGFSAREVQLLRTTPPPLGDVDFVCGSKFRLFSGLHPCYWRQQHEKLPLMKILCDEAFFFANKVGRGADDGSSKHSTVFVLDNRFLPVAFTVRGNKVCRCGSSFASFGTFVYLLFASATQVAETVSATCNTYNVHVALNPGAAASDADQNFRVASTILAYQSPTLSLQEGVGKCPIALFDAIHWRPDGKHSSWSKPSALSGAWLDFSRCKPCSLYQVSRRRERCHWCESQCTAMLTIR